MTIMDMSPEIRVKNSYESLYYYVDSNDPEVDEILREQIQKAFFNHDVLLSDRPSQELLREVMLDAYTEIMKELGGSEPTKLKMKAFTHEFDCFTKDHIDFYEGTFKRYEAKYQGDTADLVADYERTFQGQDDELSMVVGKTNKEIERIQTDSKMSYMGHVPQATAPVAHFDYEPTVSGSIRSDEEEEIKYNRQYAVNDEELESDGPEV